MNKSKKVKSKFKHHLIWLVLLMFLGLGFGGIGWSGYKKYRSLEHENTQLQEQVESVQNENIQLETRLEKSEVLLKEMQKASHLKRINSEAPVTQEKGSWVNGINWRETAETAGMATLSAGLMLLLKIPIAL